MAVMVSERVYYRIICILAARTVVGASGVVDNGLITQNSNRTVQRVPDNVGLVTPNSNKGTDKQLQQLHAFTKLLHFQPTTTESSKQPYRNLFRFHKNTALIKIICRYTDSMQIIYAGENMATPNSWDNHHNTICCCCFVSNNNHIFAIHWFTIK